MQSDVIYRFFFQSKIEIALNTSCSCLNINQM